MEFVVFIKRENVSKAEELLRKDFDLAAKQSITIRDAGVLGLKGEGSFFYVRGSDEGVKRCEHLIKEFFVNVDKKETDAAKKKILEEEDAAASGMGGLFG